MKRIAWRAVVSSIGLLGVLSFACRSAGADYEPPHHLNGDGISSGPDELFTDDHGNNYGNSLDLEKQLALDPNTNKPPTKFQFPNGLNNIRVFPGGKDWAQSIFDRAVLAAINTYGGTPPGPNNGYAVPTSPTNIKVYGLARDPEAGPTLVSNTICTVRFDVLPPGAPGGDPKDETWRPDAVGLLAIHYHEDTDSKLTWIDFEWRNPKADTTNCKAGHKKLCVAGVHSHRIIFLERAHDPLVGTAYNLKKYYGYDRIPAQDYPVSDTSKQVKHHLICDLMPYELSTAPALGEPKDPSWFLQEGGGGGDM